jgi:Protein of unknown function (DUF3159)
VTGDSPGPRRVAAASRQGGLGGAATRQEFSLAEAVGGPRGFAEAVLPGVAFIAAFTVTHALRLSVVLALAVAAILVIARAVARLPMAPAVSGAVGVAICAFTALRSGSAAGFYSWGLLLNIGYAVGLAASTLRWPRIAGAPAGSWPVIGVVVSSARGEGLAWRADPALVRLYRRLTWMWVGLFVLRLVVEVPLYEADAVSALGVARLVLGIPLFAIAVWLTWRVVRRLPPQSEAPEGPEEPARSPQR